MLFTQILEAIKKGETPSIQWEFETASLDCSTEIEDNKLDSLITPSAFLKVGELQIEMCRTFLCCTYLTDGNLTTMTFILADNCPWYSLDSSLNDISPVEFVELMEYMEDQHNKLLTPVYEDVSEEARFNLQQEIDSVINLTK